MAENGHIIGEERDARGGVPMRQPLDDAVLDGELEEGVERVDDEHEEHGRHGVALTKALTMRDGWAVLH